MNKRVNYMELLKESVADRGHDTTKSVDVKGPFLDPILGYDGGGELPTHKDASSILERYYFNQDADKGVDVNTEPIEEDASIRQVGDDKGALKDVPEDVDKSKKDAAKATELKEDEIIEEDELLEDDVENAVIERLIAEMEEDVDLLEEEEDMTDDDDADESKEEKVEENSPPQDPAAKNHEPSGDPDKDSSGLVDGDDHKGGEDVVKKATFPAGSDGVGKGIKAAMKEGEEVPGGEETPKDLDVDEKVKGEEVEESGAPVPNPATPDEEELSEFDSLDEQFEIFKEAIEDDDDDKDDDDDDDKDDNKAPNFGKDDVKV